jgi:hypothetical protein
MNLKTVAILIIVGLTSLAFSSELMQIKNWTLGGSKKSLYKIGTSPATQRGGKVAFIKSLNPKVENHFGTIMQSFSAAYYLGKKLKLTVYIKTKDATGWVGLWMRVDGRKTHALSFDNMRDRKIKGTTEWTKYEIVLDVPEKSTTISYGVLLSLGGEVWLDDLTLEEVSKATTSTGENLKMRPSNSSFED